MRSGAGWVPPASPPRLGLLRAPGDSCWGGAAPPEAALWAEVGAEEPRLVLPGVCLGVPG